MVYNGYPLTVCGISDRKRQFHPTLFVLTTGEATRDYEFVFRKLNHATEMVNGKKNTYKYIMADCAQAITEAARNIFGGGIVKLYCWFHVITAVRKKLDLIKNKEHVKQMNDQISMIQLSSTITEFVK